MGEIKFRGYNKDIGKEKKLGKIWDEEYGYWKDKPKEEEQ